MKGSNGYTTRSIEVLYALPDETENDELINMGNRHGYASLRTYLDNENRSQLMHKIGKLGALEIGNAWDLSSKSKKKILIVAHAVTINALVYEMFPESEIAQEIALDTCLGECQAIRVKTGNDGEVLSAEVI